MSIRIDYKSFNFQTLELTEAEIIRYKKGLQIGTEDLEDVIPIPSFGKAEAGSIRALKIVITMAIIAFILASASSSEDSPIYGVAIIISIIAFLGLIIYGGGVLLSFISYSAFIARRKLYLAELRKKLRNASSYEVFSK